MSTFFNLANDKKIEFATILGFFSGQDHMKKSKCCQKKAEERFFSGEMDPTRGFEGGASPQDIFNAFFSGEGLGQNVYGAMAGGAPASIYQR